MYRISVTTLEKFRRYMADTSSYDTEEALREALEGKFEGNDKTKTGQAFHAIIEHPNLCMDNKIVTNGKEWVVVENIAFPLSEAIKAAQYRESHPTMVCEIPISKEYKALNKYNVQVTGRVDSMKGKQIRDAKTKYRSPSDIYDYVNSCQWKFYNEIVGLDEFYFDVFEVKKFKELTPAADGICYLNDIVIIQHEEIKCLSYPKMAEDNQRLLDRFFEYIELRSLFHLLKPAIVKSEFI